MENNNCPICDTDLTQEKIIIAVDGTLMCLKCAAKKYPKHYVEEHGEELVPSDIYSICEWCKQESAEELTETDLGMLCDTCIRAIRSRGEEVWTK